MAEENAIADVPAARVVLFDQSGLVAGGHGLVFRSEGPDEIHPAVLVWPWPQALGTNARFAVRWREEPVGKDHGSWLDPYRVDVLFLPSGAPVGQGMGVISLAHRTKSYLPVPSLDKDDPRLSQWIAERAAWPDVLAEVSPLYEQLRWENALGAPVASGTEAARWAIVPGDAFEHRDPYQIASLLCRLLFID